MNRVAIVLNPASGSWKHVPDAATAEGRARLLRASFGTTDADDLTIRETRRSGDGAEQARAAYAEGYKTVVAAGGDGTIREVISGIYQLDGVRMGILPVGTANVLARSLGIPVTDMAEAARIIECGKERRLDLGLCNGSVFALHAGIGLDGAVVRTTSPRLKRRFGRIAYVANSVRMAFRTGPSKVRITIDDVQESYYNAYQVLVANVAEYGGSLRLGDHVTPNDGLLDLVICKRRGSTVLSALLDGIALSTNRLTLQRNVEYIQVRAVRIECSRRLDIQLDGDPSGTTPAEIRVAPTALCMIVP